MNRADIVRRVRAYTRDLSNSIFRQIDVTDFINEGVDRFASYISQFRGMQYLEEDTQSPILLPASYHYLLAIFSAARCFGQDERHYQASTLMNEFETKLEELKNAIENGDVVITDPDGNPVDGADVPTDYVRDVYFTRISTDEVIGEG